MSLEQIKFVDKKLLPLYGFSGIDDYQTKVSIKELSNQTDHIIGINNLIPEMIKLFKTGSLNLSRKKYNIDTVKLSMALLRNLLKQINVPFQMEHTNSGNVMRLIPINIMLMSYINHKNMNNIEHTHKGTEKVIGVYQELNEDNQTVIHELVEITEAKHQFSPCQWVNLNSIYTPVKSLTLVNLSPNYTYTLSFGGQFVGKSSLINGFQTFDFVKMRENNQILDYFFTLEGSYYQYLSKKERAMYIDFTRIDNIWIDVEVLDPYDTFHIYNRVTGDFMQDEYQITIEGIILDNYQKSYYKELYTLYPNHTYYGIFIHFPAREIQLESKHSGYFLTSYIHSQFPQKNCKVDFIDGKIDFSKVDHPIKQITHNSSKMSQALKQYFPEYFDEICNNTINMSEVDTIDIVLDSKSKNLHGSVTYYNIRVRVNNEPPIWKFIDKFID